MPTCKDCSHNEVCELKRNHYYLGKPICQCEDVKVACHHFTPNLGSYRTSWIDEYGTCEKCNRSITEIFDADSYMTTGILEELKYCPFCGLPVTGGI